MKKLQKGFTLVELIVVITILAILGTIAFISLQGYSQDARDSKVVSDVRSITSAVETMVTEGTPIASLVNDAGNDLRDITGVTGTTYTGTGTFAGTLALTGATIRTGDINFVALKQNWSDFGTTTYKMATLTHVTGTGTATEGWSMYQVVGAKGLSPNQTAVVKGNYLPGSQTGTGILGLMSAGTGTVGNANGLVEGAILPDGL
jgi:prepilin-type N-terminal cleavage/methylation domain-containing protein